MPTANARTRSPRIIRSFYYNAPLQNVTFDIQVSAAIALHRNSQKGRSSYFCQYLQQKLTD